MTYEQAFNIGNTIDGGIKGTYATVYALVDGSFVSLFSFQKEILAYNADYSNSMKLEYESNLTDFNDDSDSHLFIQKTAQVDNIVSPLVHTSVKKIYDDKFVPVSMYPNMIRLYSDAIEDLSKPQSYDKDLTKRTKKLQYAQNILNYLNSGQELFVNKNALDWYPLNTTPYSEESTQKSESKHMGLLAGVIVIGAIIWKTIKH